MVYEALAFRRWVPQSRMEMDSVMDPRIPKNVSSEKEPCDSQEKKKKSHSIIQRAALQHLVLS